MGIVKGNEPFRPIGSDCDEPRFRESLHIMTVKASCAGVELARWSANTDAGQHAKCIYRHDEAAHEKRTEN